MSIGVPSCTFVPEESTRTFRTLPVRTSHDERLCWMAIARVRYRYAVTSRLAERRELAANAPRTDRPVMATRMPTTVNRINISMKVKPATACRAGRCHCSRRREISPLRKAGSWQGCTYLGDRNAHTSPCSRHKLLLYRTLHFESWTVRKARY